MAVARYYARNEQDKQFDNQIRSMIHKDGDKVHMALYIQNQEILNLLRRIMQMLSDDDE